ncbi:cytochrome b5 domain-containing protein [Patescibacteria group bacterium]|nr:cytochrome b5 domain-containing protein [Patescibacteria group bacterium]
MALQKREKKLLKVLAAVAVVSAIILFKDKIFKGKTEEIKEEIVDGFTDTMEKRNEEIERTVSGGGGARRGGGGGGGTAAQTVSSKEFQTHNNAQDCWVLINGIVYDITSFVESYETSLQTRISQYCGTFGFEAGFLSENPTVEHDVINVSAEKGVIQ